MDWIFILLTKGIIGFFKACFLLSRNIVAYLYNNHFVRKTIRKVEQDNIFNRNIDMFKATIDQIFPNGFHNNTFISGGDKSLRTELICSGIGNTSIPSIIIHNSNQTLANRLFGVNTVVISNGSKNYDPFYLRSDNEILDMIIDSVPKSYHLEYSASDYIQGMLMFLHSKNIRPTLHRLTTCPHSELIGNINAQISSGKIDGKLGRSIIMKLNAGQAERYKIDRYFRDLETECQNIMFDPKTGNCYDIEQVISCGKNIVIDVGGTICPLFLNLLCSQIRNLKRKNPNFNIIIDDIPLNIDEVIIKELLEKTMQGLIIASEDINFLFENDESLFHTYYSNCYNKLILRQSNGVSAKRFSDQIGTYKKKDIKNTIPETTFQLSAAIPFGVPLNHIIEEKDEPRVSVNDMQVMERDQAYYYDYSANKWKDLSIE